jgi:seryl-tRNA synthetase
MLDLRFVVDNLEEVRKGLARRNPEAVAPLQTIAELAAVRRDAIVAAESHAARRNAANLEMSKLPKQSPEFAARRDELKTLSAELKDLEKKRAEIEAQIEQVLLGVPNLPDPSTPDGRSSEDNPVARVWGERPSFAFEPKAHWDIGTALGIIDFERAAKLSGPRFAVLFGAAARMERALVAFMLDLHTREHGYREVLPPFLVKDSALRGTGQLPKFEQDLFKTSKSDPDKTYDLYLIPTAEVPVTNLHADEILDPEAMPVAYAAFTPCFRSEAGSYGKDVRGLIRQHQFDKVELVRFCAPEDSAAQLELLTSHAEKVLQGLGLHYRVVKLCAGDIGFSAAMTYDLEVWLPGLSAYREISSCSNFGDFQARRAAIRYRPAKGQKPRLVHTINGSGLAVGRTLVAILEQYQQADGSVVVPEALRPYMGTDVIRAGG